jgi:DNA-binding NarL/FixJ family response regulator
MSRLADLLQILLEGTELSLHRPITVILADDHAMVRESLARVLDACDEISVVGQVGDGKELVSVVRQFRPECLVMDYSMPNHDPTEVIKRLLEEFPPLKILMLTVHENVHYAVRTLEAGAHGYLIKSAAVDELMDAILTIKDGNVYISKKISPEVWSQLRRPKGKRDGLDALSQREFDVLRLIGSGATLQECAKQLGVSVSTVSTYRGRILEKLNLTSTSDLVRFAIESKMIG